MYLKGSEDFQLNASLERNMETDRPSESAVYMAILRAAHLYIDGEPKILEDRFAILFIGNKYETIFQKSKDFFQTSQAKIVRSLTLCRSRITENLLDEAINRGVQQYIILGAGLDSFAFRRLDISNKLQIFEIDHPKSQQWKRKSLQKAGIIKPDNLSLIPVDFEKQSLPVEMIQGGYNPDAPSFFSWLGVTQFLSEEAVFATLDYVAKSAAPGSEIVFQYCLPDSSLNEEEQKQRAFARQKGDEIGEPWKSTFNRDYLISKLKELGFNKVENIDQKAAESHLSEYFLNRDDGLELFFGNSTALMSAKL